MTAGWLRCSVYKGMFSDEVAIKYEDDAPGFFVPRDKVMGVDNGTGKVAVQVFSDQGMSWAVLPTDHHDVIRVREADLMGQ